MTYTTQFEVHHYATLHWHEVCKNDNRVAIVTQNPTPHNLSGHWSHTWSNPCACMCIVSSRSYKQSYALKQLQLNSELNPLSQ